MNKILHHTTCLNPQEIRAYLSEDLDEDQRFDVENHLLDCPLCSDAVEGFANNHNLVDELPELDFLENTKPVTPTLVKKLPARKSWVINIAASLLLLSIPIGTYLYWQSNETERILAANFVEQDNPFIGALRSGDNSLIENTQLQKGLEAYQNQQYSSSLNILTDFLNTEPENSLANYYRGMAAAKLEDWSVAEKQLKFTRINIPDYYDEATWQLTAVYLAQDKKDSAKTLLYELVENDKSYYQKQALEVLKKLK